MKIFLATRISVIERAGINFDQKFECVQDENAKVILTIKILRF